MFVNLMFINIKFKIHIFYKSKYINQYISLNNILKKKSNIQNMPCTERYCQIFFPINFRGLIVQNIFLVQLVLV